MILRPALHCIISFKGESSVKPRKILALPLVPRGLFVGFSLPLKSIGESMWQANCCLTLFLVSGALMVMDRMVGIGVRREKFLLSC